MAELGVLPAGLELVHPLTADASPLCELVLAEAYLYTTTADLRGRLADRSHEHIRVLRNCHPSVTFYISHRSVTFYISHRSVTSCEWRGWCQSEVATWLPFLMFPVFAVFLVFLFLLFLLVFVSFVLVKVANFFIDCLININVIDNFNHNIIDNGNDNHVRMLING